MRIFNHANSKIVNVFWERPVAHVFILKRFARNENRYNADDFSTFFSIISRSSRNNLFSSRIYFFSGIESYRDL